MDKRIKKKRKIEEHKRESGKKIREEEDKSKRDDRCRRLRYLLLSKHRRNFYLTISNI